MFRQALIARVWMAGVVAALTVGHSVHVRGEEGERLKAATDIRLELVGLGNFRLTKFLWGFANSGSASSYSTLAFNKVLLDRELDEASTDLMLFCARGEPAPAGKIIVRREDDPPVNYLVVTLRQITCLRYSSESKFPSAAPPIEKITLEFSEFEAQYLPHAVVRSLKVDCPELKHCLPMQGQ